MPDAPLRGRAAAEAKLREQQQQQQQQQQLPVLPAAAPVAAPAAQGLSFAAAAPVQQAVPQISPPATAAGVRVPPVATHHAAPAVPVGGGGFDDVKGLLSPMLSGAPVPGAPVGQPEYQQAVNAYMSKRAVALQGGNWQAPDSKSSSNQRFKSLEAQYTALQDAVAQRVGNDVLPAQNGGSAKMYSQSALDKQATAVLNELWEGVNLAHNTVDIGGAAGAGLARDDQCMCGTMFLPDSKFCRSCGYPRMLPAKPTSPNAPRGGRFVEPPAAVQRKSPVSAAEVAAQRRALEELLERAASLEKSMTVLADKEAWEEEMEKKGPPPLASAAAAEKGVPPRFDARDAAIQALLAAQSTKQKADAFGLLSQELLKAEPIIEDGTGATPTEPHAINVSAAAAEMDGVGGGHSTLSFHAEMEKLQNEVAYMTSKIRTTIRKADAKGGTALAPQAPTSAAYPTVSPRLVDPYRPTMQEATQHRGAMSTPRSIPFKPQQARSGPGFLELEQGRAMADRVRAAGGARMVR
eukprot:TRINITY_DN10684_c0_g1_i1.p1 TRINITY_DN10684_c0_g1~~TRINITY_DN10684_c0_g1_i1.p1  ORF type:complete len:521 (-),score=140.81 TRINITY_DN10684_c0_g1_i1:330-1892(-)